MDPIEQQLLDLNHQNRILRLQLEATREAGIQALKSASQKLSDTYRKRWEELKKTQKDEKRRMEVWGFYGVFWTIKRSILQFLGMVWRNHDVLQDTRKEWKRKMEEEEEKNRRLAEVEERLKRMEEEKQILSEKKRNLEVLLHQTPLTTSAIHRNPILEREIRTLEDQLRHLQVVIGSQHHALHCIIYNAEELRNESRRQDERIEEMEERLLGLEAEVLWDGVVVWGHGMTWEDMG
uniref:Coiled-coil domain containing 68 n=1 Tax=Meleagris gallopavo TaxID=9103 RepID=A0A803XS22_MELGA